MAKARMLDPELKNAVTAAYKLGMMDGEKIRCRQCRNRLVSAMQTTNSNLWDMLNDLDKVEPIEGLLLSFKDADEVIAALRAGTRKSRLANILRRRMKESGHGLERLLGELVTTR